MHNYIVSQILLCEFSMFFFFLVCLSFLLSHILFLFYFIVYVILFIFLFYPYYAQLYN